MKLKLDRTKLVEYEYYEVSESYRRDSDGNWEMKEYYGWTTVEGEGEIKALEDGRKVGHPWPFLLWLRGVKQDREITSPKEGRQIPGEGGYGS